VRWFWPQIALLLAYLALRLHRLTLYPAFMDEVFHLRWAWDTLALHPFGGFPDGKILIPWVLAPFLPTAHALWVGRAAIALIGVGGLAALLALGRALLGRPAALLAGMGYLVLPFAFFFERLAMADPLAASLGLIAAWLIVAALRSRGRWLPGLAGVALALAILAKLPMIAYLAVPALGWLLLGASPPNPLSTSGEGEASCRAAWPVLGRIYAVCLAALVIVIVPGVLRVGSFGIARAQGGNLVRADLVGLPGRIAANLSVSIGWLGAALTWPLLALGGAGLVWALVRRERGALFVAALALLGWGEFWALSTHLLPRYFLPGAAAWLLLGAAMAVWGIKQIAALGQVGRWLAALVALVTLTGVLTPLIRFVHVAYTEPARLPLPEYDRHDYIVGITSGYGVEEAARFLAGQAAGSPGVTAICIAAITCDWLNVYLMTTPGVALERTDMLTPAWLAGEVAAGRSVYLADDDPPQLERYDPGPEYRVVRALRFERPGGATAFTLRQIVPAEGP